MGRDEQKAQKKSGDVRMVESASEKKKKEKAIEQKRKEIVRKLGKLARKKVVSKRTFKKSKTTLHLKQEEVPDILGEPNRFFKHEMGEAEHALFFR